MKRAITCTVLAFIVVGIIDAVAVINKNSTKEKIYHNEAIVVGVGQCNDRECAVTIKDSKTSEIKYITSSDPVALGRTMYQMCWYSKAEGHMCYVNYSTKKQTN